MLWYKYLNLAPHIEIHGLFFCEILFVPRINSSTWEVRILLAVLSIPLNLSLACTKSCLPVLIMNSENHFTIRQGILITLSDISNFKATYKSYVNSCVWRDHKFNKSVNIPIIVWCFGNVIYILHNLFEEYSTWYKNFLSSRLVNQSYSSNKSGSFSNIPLSNLASVTRHSVLGHFLYVCFIYSNVA